VGVQDVGAEIAARGGLIRTRELLALGFTQATLRRAVYAGALFRVRKGWYSSPGLSPVLKQSSRVGGRLTCVSAAIARGLWVPPSARELHVAVRGNACQLRDPADSGRRLFTSDSRGGSVLQSAGPEVVVHWSDRAAGGRLLTPLGEMFEHLCACASPDFVFVVAESALNLGELSAGQWGAILETVPLSHRRLLRHAGSQSQSGTESLFLLRMRRAGVRVRQQVQIGGDRVDFLIGDALVVEIDSHEFHDELGDRRRDARLGTAGRRVLRFMYEQILDEWPSVEASVLAAVSRGDHLL
jgi:very-short-patch-repair endonuclease